MFHLFFNCISKLAEPQEEAEGSIIPPHHKDATKPQEAYLLEDCILKNCWWKNNLSIITMTLETCNTSYSFQNFPLAKIIKVMVNALLKAVFNRDVRIVKICEY